VFNVNGISSCSHSFCVLLPEVGDVLVLACPYNAAAAAGAVFVSAEKLPLPCAGTAPAFSNPDNRNVSVVGVTELAVHPPEVFETEIPKYS
jgi:hypothetical protein